MLATAKGSSVHFLAALLLAVLALGDGLRAQREEPPCPNPPALKGPHTGPHGAKDVEAPAPSGPITGPHGAKSKEEIHKHKGPFTHVNAEGNVNVSVSENIEYTTGLEVKWPNALSGQEPPPPPPGDPLPEIKPGPLPPFPGGWSLVSERNKVLDRVFLFLLISLFLALYSPRPCLRPRRARAHARADRRRII